MFGLNIIIPHYNRVKMCIELLDTIYNEIDINTTKVIVVDDFSTEDTSLLYKYLQDKNGYFISNVYSKGPSGARNTGIDNINPDFEYLLFADSDDLLIEGWHQAIQLEILKKPQSDIFYFKRNDTKNSLINHLIDKYYPLQNEKDACLELIFTNANTWGKVWRTKFFLENNLRYAPVNKLEDIELGIRAACFASKICISKEKIYFVRICENSESREFTDKTWEAVLEVTFKKGDLVYDYITRKHLKYRIVGTNMINEAWNRKIGIRKIFQLVHDLKKHHMHVFPSPQLLLGYLRGK